MNILKYTPIITVALFETGNIGQIIQMIIQHSALGQSPIAWLLYTVGLLMWFLWWKRFEPTQKMPRYAALAGAIINFAVLLTVLWFI
jgi:hypothetical protein